MAGARTNQDDSLLSHFERGGDHPSPPIRAIRDGTLVAMIGKEMPEHDNIETILRPGQLVGTQYRAVGLIAKGGMAAVWAGVNVNTGKRVALKLILQSFASNRDAIELFRREALTASSINHPNVVNIFDVIDHQGRACIVMELLDGETLASYLARAGPQSLEKTLALLLPAMRGVAAANAQGVVHRDLKPANIFLCSSPAGQLITTKVLDFGISVMMRQAGETAPATERLAMFGTPAYMAPEAVELSPNIDGRADVYGFGVLFFEALTGKLPFPGPPGMELLRRILADPPPSVTLYRPDLPRDVVDLIASALAKDPHDRFRDMEQLVHATEDRLLPPLSSRSLTPMSGIHLLSAVESIVGTSIPVVQAVLEKEPSGRAHVSGTRALYSMANEPLRKTHLTDLAERRRLSLTSTGTQTRRKQVSRAAPRRFYSWRIATGTAIITFLIVTAWVFAPSPSSGTSKSGPPAHLPDIAVTKRGPVLTSLPNTPKPATSPTFVLELVKLAENVARPAIHVPVLHFSRHVSRADSPTQKPPRVNLPVPFRAGALTTSEF